MWPRRGWFSVSRLLWIPVICLGVAMIFLAHEKPHSKQAVALTLAGMLLGIMPYCVNYFAIVTARPIADDKKRLDAERRLNTVLICLLGLVWYNLDSSGYRGAAVIAFALLVLAALWGFWRAIPLVVEAWDGPPASRR